MARLTDEEIQRIIELVSQVTGNKGVLITPEMTNEDIKKMVDKLEHKERVDN